MTVESQEMGAVQRRERFIQDRFGLFILWGIYALAARHGGNGLAEWIKSGEKMSDAQYQRYFDHFDPDLYDPAAFLIYQWIGAGRRARVLKTGRGGGLWKWYVNCNQLSCSTTAWALTRIFIHLNSSGPLSGCRLMDDASRGRRAIL